MSYDDIERREEVLEKYSKNMEGHQFTYVQHDNATLTQVCTQCWAVKGTHSAWAMCSKKNVWPELRYKAALRELEGLRAKRSEINAEIHEKLMEIDQHKREMEALKVEE